MHLTQKRSERGECTSAKLCIASAGTCFLPALQVTATTKARAELPVEAILLHPAAEKAAPGPAILWSHGRPHHAFPRKLAAALCIPGGRAGVQGYAGQLQGLHR